MRAYQMNRPDQVALQALHEELRRTGVLKGAEVGWPEEQGAAAEPAWSLRSDGSSKLSEV